MRFTQKLIVAVAAFGLLATTGMAQNVAGNWNGKVVLDMSKLPKAKTPEQQKQMDAGLALLKKMTIKLNLKSNKTYSVVVAGMPGTAASKPQTSEGTWTQKGNQIMLTAVKNNGKPTKDKTPQPMTIAAGGKSMTMAFPGGVPGKVVFSR